ncbi:hypothetical protein ENSA5_68010 [Enhygromyxa salina]|uniref:Uncharacterized protein n=1 Tax=Enhygromyxa salina TaxID=215803 RepID=A0A2S9XB39_9BACT|nr:hypothetical protein [Enhygromyxa salina]PRP90065.1 hypothetical protein ENSA5_68010 [Enhygromyxa salina]
MTIEGVMIIMVGSSATLFLLSGAWWLWRRSPMPEPPLLPPQSGPPLGPPPDAPQWMAWSEPGAPPPPPSAERTLFEQSKLEPVTELMGHHSGELDKARTMFFFKKPPPGKIDILPEGAEVELEKADKDAQLQCTDQAQTAPVRKTKAMRRPPPPPPPPRPN